MNTHLEERSALIACPILGRKTIIQTAPHTPAKQGVALSCYRSLLCEKEGRDCWYALPVSSTVEPFNYEHVAARVKAQGEIFEHGLDPVMVIVRSGLAASTKRIMLEELLENPEEFSPWNYTSDLAREALRQLPGPDLQ